MIRLQLLIFFSQILIIRCELINDPTLKPVQSFSADQDGETIRKELTSWTTDRNKIAKIIFHRTYNERRQIDEYYNQKFCKDRVPNDKCPLRSGLKSISTYSLDALYGITLMAPEGILAKIVHDSIKDHNGEVGAIEEIVCANDEKMKNLINQYYQTNYQTTVENDLKTFHGDDQGYQNVMQKYCWKGLCQNGTITSENADTEAQALRNIDPEKDKEGFKKKLIELLDNNCEPDLKQIFEKYRQENKGISDAVDKAFEVEREKRAYNVLVRYTESTCKFYAEELQNTLDAFLDPIIPKINRIILTRCERDLLCILKEYSNKHQKTFTNALKVGGDWSCDGNSIFEMHSIPLWQTMKHHYC